MGYVADQSAHVLRARRTAAGARVLMAACGLALLGFDQVPTAARWVSVLGFLIILGTSIVQLLTPRASWLKVEESLSCAAGVLIVGLSNQHVTVLTLLWLCAVASGVLARGGRAHATGRILILVVLALPILREMRVRPEYAALCVATITLLLTCGRLTQELRWLLAQARHDADFDGLTGARSRTAFRDVLDAIAAATTPEDPCAVLLFDLDAFGYVNKTEGHAAGDALLANTVARIQALVGPESPIGRLGGDEFAVVTRAADPTELARRIVDRLDQPHDGSTPVALSAGVARGPRDGQDADSLLRAADIALRVAQRTGKQQVALFAGGSLSSNGPSGARAELARLIAGEGLAMAVQPIYEVPSGAVHGYEALARFGQRSTDSPLHWFALADELGLRDELELACLAAALRLFPERPPGTSLSVNVSGPVLLDARTRAMLDALPNVAGLVIEITEVALLESGTALRAAIEPMVARGVHFAIDDLGAGYSGLRQITTLRPTYLKLDRSLVRDVATHSDTAALIQALLGYAQQTGGHLVAEGVETGEQLAALVTLGVPLVQGFYLGRPGPPWPGEYVAPHAARDLTPEVAASAGVRVVARVG